MLNCKDFESYNNPISIKKNYNTFQNYCNDDNNSENFIFLDKCLTNVRLKKSTQFDTTDIQDEYCLKKNFFNPNKFSPPNNWSVRLDYRLNH